jgi:hypothetical protein
LWNLQAHYRIHKSLPLTTIPSHINPIHTIPLYLSKTLFNTIHPPTSCSSQWSLSFWLSQQYPTPLYVSPPFVLHTLPISSSLTW